MNPLIKLYNELHPEGPDTKISLLRENFSSDEEYQAYFDKIYEVLKITSEEQRDEFIEWCKNLPDRVADRLQGEKDAEEVRKRLEWEHVQNQLPGQFPNDKYSG